MRVALSILLSFGLAFGAGSCASSPPGSGPSDIEVAFADSEPDRPYEEIRPVISRHWNVQEGLRLLQLEARKLGADAVIRVEYDEYYPRSGWGTTASTSRRRAEEGYAQVIMEFRGVAVVWSEGSDQGS